MAEVKPAYSYTGVCSVYANYGRYNAAAFQGSQEVGTTVFTATIEKPVNYGISVQDEDHRDQWGDPQSSVQTLDITPLTYNNLSALRLSGFPVAQKHSSINPKEPNPFIGGFWAAYYEALPVDLTPATHLQVKVFPRTKTTLIIELYDYDGKEPAKAMVPDNWCTLEVLKGLKTVDKQKYNFCLPVSDDQFKVVLQLEPTGQWQTLDIPLSSFVDWNKKQASCKESIPGINENIGDGILNPGEGQAFVIQYTLVAPNWDLGRNEVYVSREIKFIKKGGEK